MLLTTNTFNMFAFRKSPGLFIAIALLICTVALNGQTNMEDQVELGFPKIDLPDPDFNSGISVEDALMHRRSVREFSQEQITMAQVSQLLWAAYGITERKSFPGFLDGGLRTAPSAGGLYPLEIYLIAGNVEGLEAGVFKYESNGHLLIRHYEGDVRGDLAKAALDQNFIMDAPMILFFAAVFKRTTQKYGERGRERYVCMDLGHSAQNVYLQAFSLNLGTCAVGAFTDQIVSSVLMLPEDEEPLYIMPVGKAK
ncbi:MAG: SagB/ThcOx family dehydrogenase [Bacteroidales bacterium]|nr:SagB/ThcOx family dehydrogenase [Bacteroidales bacterium]MCF8403414.1 SagB/ThcOx family dehydrogenase [Bacteroidales bacterium]